jgi:hypothetical protein
MISITATDLMTIIFILADWYQAHGIQYLKGKPGAKPKFSDSEVITLLLAMDFIPFPSETQFLGFIRANYLSLFPRLIDQSQSNRRARALRLLVEELRRTWLVQLGVFQPTRLLLYTKPIPVVGVKRCNRHSDFAGSASYGHCPSRNMKYFGYKLVAVTTFSGIPVVYVSIRGRKYARDLWQHYASNIRQRCTTKRGCAKGERQRKSEPKSMTKAK